MALRDKPRPSVYWPNTPSQWTQSSVDDCTWYAVEFAFEAASNTHLSMHPVEDIRVGSSDTVGGTPIAVALWDTYKMWPKKEDAKYQYGSFSHETIEQALRDGKTIVWGGDYEKLPAHYRKWTNNDTFDHAMSSRDYRVHRGAKQTFLYDPLGGGPQREPYDGEWIALNALYKFNWGRAGTHEYVGIVYNDRADAQTGTDKMIKGDFTRTSERYVKLPIGVQVYDAPEGKKIRQVRHEKRYHYFGFVGGGWWAIGIWYDGADVIAYIKRNDDYERGTWETQPEPTEPDPHLARIDELEDTLRDIRDIATNELQEPSGPDIIALSSEIEDVFINS